MKTNHHYLVTLLLLFFLLGNGYAQPNQNKTNPWSAVSESFIPLAPNKVRQIIPQSYETLSLDVPMIQNILAEAPVRNAAQAKNKEVELELPMPDGTFQRFRIYEASVMHPDLAAKFPMIQSYAGQGIDDPTAFLRFDLTQKGFHAMVLSGSQPTVYIDPYSTNDNEHYICYFKTDFVDTDGGFTCHADEVNEFKDPTIDAAAEKVFGDCQLRTYRLALACTQEYAAFHGGTIPSVMAAMVTTMTRVNGVYERDAAITMQMVPNNDQLIFLSNDPYSNNNGSTMLGQNINTCNSVIGSANYDIGHVFSTGGGGVAYLQSVCGSSKAGGVTGQGSPVGDPFDIDYVCHEMGHQFGGRHTQNNNCNRDSQSSYEPGSASTIMGYAGICNPNVQTNSDDYFHVNSLALIGSFATGGGNSCAVTTNTGNSAPVANAGADYTIPRNTPFVLTGSATDANGDALTYCWEQYDKQVATMPPSANSTSGPAFRSFDPTTSPSRYFPRLQDLVNTNGSTTWEVLGNANRNYTFRLTVRDNNVNGGCTDDDEAIVAVTTSAGPFVVNSPNTNVSWPGNSSQTVTWDVASTNTGAVGAATVDILLSTDGGLTYPTTLASDVPNDGSHNVTLPSTQTNTARIMVKGHNHIFFDISNQNFTISAPVSGFILEASSTSTSVCAPNNATFNLTTTALGGFSGNITLSESGLPASLTSSFSTNPIGGSGSSILTIGNTGSVASGTYNFTVTGVSGGQQQSVNLSLDILAGTPGQVSLASPNNGATGVSTSPTLSWNPPANPGTYNIQVSTTANFSNIVSQNSGQNGTNYLAAGLMPNTTYYWQVRSESGCGNGPWSATYSFTTANETCETVESTDVPLTIPTTISTVTSDLTIPVSGTITDVNVVGLDVTHTWINDLQITLTSPNGTTVSLINQICDQENNILINFDDEAANAYGSIPCPPTAGDTYQPNQALSGFDGENLNGLWTLAITDVANEDGGILNDWGLEICYNAASGSPLMLTVSGNNIGCAGESTGSATATATGGSGSYTYTWSNGGTSSTISGLLAGTYSVSVSDGMSVETGSVTLTEPSTLAVSVTGVDATSGNNGSATASPAGGTPGYEYNWSNGGTEATITGLAPGTYSVTVTDNNSCEVIGSVIILDGSSGGCISPSPSNITTTSSSATIDWIAVPGAQIYRVRWRPVAGGGWSAQNVATNSITINGLQPETEYEFNTRTKCADGSSTEWSATFNFMTEEGAGGGGNCIQWEADDLETTATTATITFLAVVGADRYKIRYRPVTGGPWTRVVTSNTTFNLSGLLPGTEYEYNTTTRCTNWLPWSPTTYNFTTSLLFGEGEALVPTGGEDFSPGLVEMKLVPNPATDFVTVHLDTEIKGQVIIRDYTGQLIQQQVMNGQQASVGVAHLPGGVYFITVLSEEHEPVTQKLIRASH